MSPVLVFRRLILLLTAIFFLGLWYHLLSETAIQTIGGLSKGTMTLSGLHHDSSAASKEMTPSPSTDWMHEPLAIESKNEFIKFHGNEAPSGYRMMDCQESKGLEHKLLNCVDDWEICGFSGNIGKASGRRGDLSPSVDCESREQGYGCYIARKMGLFDMRAYEEPIMPGKSRAASRSYVVERIKSDLASYVSSPEFEKRTKQISLENTTGIVILAGSARSTSLALITIKMIRHGIYMSNISIELHWQKDEKMDSVTWGVIQQAFAPIDGFDIASRWKEVYPNLIKDLQLRKASGFPAKVASLLVTRFQHVLMMEANSMLMLPPSVLFRNPHYKINGNLFWPSTLQGKVDECAYQKLGLKSKETRLSLDGGKGCCPRGTSGGQLLINRAMHLDVLMFALANAQAHEGSCSLAGLKAELFPLAFAQTSKAHLFCQVEAPPSGIFSWLRV